MKVSIVRSLLFIAIAALAACSGKTFGGASTLLPQSSDAFAGGGNLSVGELGVLESPRDRVCPAVPAPGHYTCFAIAGTYPIDAREALAPRAGSCLHKPGCYIASDLQAAYGITAASKNNGKGVTVGIVDAWGYPAAKSDLAAYRNFAGLSACSSCLKIVNQTGGSTLPKVGTKSNFSWQFEQALDLDMVTAICPNCNIVLVQTKSNSNGDLATGIKTALSMATIVTNSFGGPEGYATQALFDSHPGKVITASAGDDGAGFPTNSTESQPCGFQGVVCVGGTSLFAPNGKRSSETVWETFKIKDSQGVYINLGATGSGCSAMVAKPSWQKDKGCTMRSATDISVVGDPATGVVTACTPCAKTYGASSPYLGGWGGTSASSPIVAAMYALAGNAASLTSAPQKIWTSPASSFHAITKGFNDGTNLLPFPGGATSTGLICGKAIAYICKAGTGTNGTYSGPTGWGSPNGLGAL